jgi:hypothetical protein
MEKIIKDPLPEVIFGSKDPKTSRTIRKLLNDNRIKKIIPRVYTSNLEDEIQVIIKRNLYAILSKLYSGAVLSHKTAIIGGPTEDGVIFLTYKYTKKFALPGITVRLLQGHGALESDMPFLDGLHMSSQPRAFLENLTSSRGEDNVSKTIPKKQLEEKLDLICRTRGVEELNKIRDKALDISQKLGLQNEYEKLNKIVGALLKTRPAKDLTSDVAKARALGVPYDAKRLELFQSLFVDLKSEVFEHIKEGDRDSQAHINLSFFEAYFSNYIEGTRFEIDEAKSIVFNNKIDLERPADSHDILGTFSIVGNKSEMMTLPDNFESFLTILRSRHSQLMSGHPDKQPGAFKDKLNRAGETIFVEPELVNGTLAKGFDIYKSLEDPVSRALFMKYLISEIHPFNDGNGRMARIMMNSELFSANLLRIFVPTVLRDDYLLALRALSRSKNSTPYLKFMMKCQRFVSTINFMDFDQALLELKGKNAFLESSEGRLKE